jgi:circadian clock protein KaiC
VIHSSRPSLHGLEMHLLSLHKYIREFKPHTVIIDPISSLVTIGSKGDVTAMLARLMDMLKIHHINSLFTSLSLEKSIISNALAEDVVSSLVDTWVKVRNEESNNNLIRSLYIEKSRGMGHTNEIRDFIVTDKGIKIMSGNVLMKQGQNGTGKVGTLSENGSNYKS